MFLGATILDTAAAGRSEDLAGDPDAQYVQQMTQDFGLQPRQQQALRVVMQRYREEQLQVFRHANFDQLPESLRAELTAA
jgi:Spy/CpxP family protein refolding chaperone